MTMAAPLTSRELAVLTAVCATFQPPEHVGDAGYPIDRLLGLIALLPDPDDRRRLRQLLRLLGLPLVNFALSGRWAAFDRLDLAARVAVLQGWANSRIELRRSGFQALKRLVNIAWYGWPAADGSHPAWRAAGYPGPRPPIDPAAASGSGLPSLDISGDTVLDCDVVICGSGAGGGVAAGVLAEAGRSVVVLEKGGNLGPADFTQIEGDMLGAGYLNGGLLMTQSGSLPILAGSCLGGGTVINWTSSFPLPEPIRAEWDRRSGLSLFGSAAFAESLDRVARRLQVNTDNSEPGPRDRLMELGLRANGWQVAPIPRNAVGCLADECGYCGYGCRCNAKQSTARTYLADAVAAAAGARIVVRCDVEKVLVEGGRAVGVVGSVRTADGRTVRLTVRARAVVAACGAVNTPALMVRSGLSGKLIGRGLRLHPVTAIAGSFDERVEPWTGILQARYSDQFADFGTGYGARFETGPIHWALPASAFGWDDPERHRQDVHSLANLSVVGILLRDQGAGRVAVARSGLPRVHYELSGPDAANLRVAMRGAAQVLASAGARQLMTLQQPPVRAVPGAAGWLDTFDRAIAARGLARGRMALISFHQMASCAMAADPKRGVVAESGESFEMPGLYVADASAFPTSSGVNPMITIMAIADQVARGIAARW